LARLCIAWLCAAALLSRGAAAAGDAGASHTAARFGPEQLPAVSDADDPLVDASLVVPGLLVQLAYATSQNITGHALYPPDARCLLRKSIAARLADVARALDPRGLRLVAWDCARPHAAQEALFHAHPHPGAVADPKRGSLHERGVAIDLALADREGKLVALPTAFDAFGPRAAADAALPDGPAKEHRDALIAAMHDAGFRVNPKEWWHFSRLYGFRWPPVREEMLSAAPSAALRAAEPSAK
jgi:D-alanyl-D-alanine dipeptidase